MRPRGAAWVLVALLAAAALGSACAPAKRPAPAGPAAKPPVTEAPVAAPAPALRCDPVPDGLAAELSEHEVIVLGEFHGTVEMPRAFGTLACHAANLRDRVLVGVELPQREQPLFEAALAAPTESEARAALSQSEFFARSYQDGRTSRAMGDLVLAVRELRRTGRAVELFAFDPTGKRNRDTGMARLVEERRAAHPGALTLLLVGNLHAKRTIGSPWVPDYRSVTHQLLESGASLLSLRFVHAGGEAWYCNGGTPDSCGPKPAGGRDRGEAPFVEWDDEDGRDYDGAWYLGPVSASPPGP